MAIEFGTNDFESVRKLIDVTLTADQLPDDVLSLDIYKGASVRYIGYRTSNEDADAKQAAVLHMTILAIPSVPQVISHSQAGHSATIQATNWAKRIAQLEAMRDEAIARSEALNPTDVGAAYDLAGDLTHFTVAPADQFAL